ncbi:hypothetical protein OIV83_006028 [Microbotryomycetes sp. JL201]|nr:hypothetical protein OIV83_006028 [Microbotryomycetes sp. JL201]
MAATPSTKSSAANDADELSAPGVVYGAADEDDVIDIATISEHLQHHRKRHRVARSRMQLVSRELVDAASERPVVGDDFFVDPDAVQRDTRRLRVHLSIAGVQGRANKTIKRFTGKRGAKLEGQARPAAKGQHTLDDRNMAATAPVYGAMPNVTESPTGSSDSLSSASTSLASTSATPALNSDNTPSWLMPSSSSIEPLSRAPTLPTLAEQPSSLLSQPSSGPADRDAPSRTLTLDGNPDTSHKQGKLFKLRPSQVTQSLARRRHRLARRDTQMTEPEEDTLEKVLFDAGIVTQESERVVTDILYEHQRGLVLFGLPQFSASALLQVDPSPWTDHKLRNSPLSRHDFSLPTPFWFWIDREWMVDMSGDVDEQGWTYAVRFRSKYWRGLPETWRSFVRRRRWIRRRIYVPVPVLHAHPAPETSKIDWSLDYSPPTSFLSACGTLPLPVSEKEEIYRWEHGRQVDAKAPFLLWTSCRLDREKIALWRWWLGFGPPSDETDEADDSQACEMVSENIHYPQSKGRKASLQLPHSKPPPIVDVKDFGDNKSEFVPEDLYDILGLFEFQVSRIHFLHLVLTQHPAAHKHAELSTPHMSADPTERRRNSSRLFSEDLRSKIDFFNDVRMLMDVYQGELKDELEAIQPREIGQSTVPQRKGRRSTNGKASSRSKPLS